MNFAQNFQYPFRSRTSKLNDNRAAETSNDTAIQRDVLHSPASSRNERDQNQEVSPKRIRALDGIRGLAVSFVVAYHLFPESVPGGFIGVTVFFVLSGYLITTILLEEVSRTGRVDLATFWNRRLRRLLPAALMGIAVAIIVAQLVGDSHQLRTLPGDVLNALAYLLNWHFIAQGVQYGAAYQQPSVLQHYWSLAIEEQFYLAVSMLVTAIAFCTQSLRSRRTMWFTVFALTTAASLVTTLLMGPARHFDIYFNTLTRACEMLAGSLLAVALSKRRAIGSGTPGHRLLSVFGWLIVCALLTLVFTTRISAGWLYNGGFFAVAAFTAVLILALHHRSSLSQLFEQKPFVGIGLISYGVYVYHWPLFILISRDTTPFAGLLLAVIRLTATAAVAIVSYHFLETPIRNGSLTGRRFATTVLVIGSILALIISADVLGGAADSRDRAAPDYIPGDLRFEIPRGSENPSRVLLVGDSILHDMIPALKDEAAELGIELSTIGGPSQTLFQNRDDWTNSVLSTIEQGNPDVVVLESATGARTPYVTREGRTINPTDPDYWIEWSREMNSLTIVAGKRGARVFWVIPPPVDGINSRWYGDLVERVQRITEITERLAADNPEVGVIDWRAVGDADGRFTREFPAGSDEAIVIRADDGTHFTPAGRSLLARTTLAQLLAGWNRLGGRVSP